jgi:hypothetical protein
MKLFEEFKEYETLWEDLTEAAMTAEEKVDAWHEGTRPVNYKVAKEDKLNKYLKIAKVRGYTEIVSIIEDELYKRGHKTSTPKASEPTISEPEEEAGPEVYVDKKSYTMPKSFYLATAAIDAEIEKLDIEYSDRDNYDDHYFDGKKVQWRTMWNLFDLADLDSTSVDNIEKKLDTIAKSYSTKLGIDIDKFMLEEDGVLNICLSFI